VTLWWTGCEQRGSPEEACSPSLPASSSWRDREYTGGLSYLIWAPRGLLKLTHEINHHTPVSRLASASSRVRCGLSVEWMNSQCTALITCH
jgi:hypothetical protein